MSQFGIKMKSNLSQTESKLSQIGDKTEPHWSQNESNWSQVFLKLVLFFEVL